MMHMQLSYETQLKQVAAIDKDRAPLNHKKVNFGPVLRTRILVPGSTAFTCQLVWRA